MRTALFKMFSQEVHDLKAVVIDPRFFAERVMSARDRDAAVFDAMPSKSRKSVARKIDGET